MMLEITVRTVLLYHNCAARYTAANRPAINQIECSLCYERIDFRIRLCYDMNCVCFRHILIGKDAGNGQIDYTPG